MARIRMTKATALSLNTKKASEAELGAAYTALRDAFQKQVSRLGSGTETMQAYARPFLAGGSQELQTLRGLKSDIKNLPPDAARRSLMYSVQNLQTLMESPRLSIKGWQDIEKRTLQTLKEHRYANINKSNLAQFGSFMDAMRDLWGSKVFPSAEAAEAYNSLVEQSGGKVSSEQLGQLMMDLRMGRGSNGGVDLFAW